MWLKMCLEVFSAGQLSLGQTELTKQQNEKSKSKEGVSNSDNPGVLTAFTL